MAIESNDKEDIYDALIGFNQVTIKLSLDIEKLIDIANTQLYTNIFKLETVNNESSMTLLLSFLIAFVLISFSIYKINTLNKKILKPLYNHQSSKQE